MRTHPNTPEVRKASRMRVLDVLERNSDFDSAMQDPHLRGWAQAQGRALDYAGIWHMHVSLTYIARHTPPPHAPAR